MLTRLKVSGFKNLVDVDVYFGPFTCIAGVNGIGKSNLFDAIRFLSALADRTLIDAALSVRNEEGRTTDIRNLFHRVGDNYVDEMSFEAEMIIPVTGIDDLGQEAEASITFLRYSLTLAYRTLEVNKQSNSLEIIKEELAHIRKGDSHRHLPFPHKDNPWRKSAITGQRYTPYFISTEGEGLSRVIKLHQDSGRSVRRPTEEGEQRERRLSGGRPLSRSATNLPRTVLSVTNAAESPTALLVRREMQSWKLLQLEPSSLRKPDEFTAPTQLGIDGAHLPATLYNLARFDQRTDEISDLAESQVYSQIANRLAALLDDVLNVQVDRDEKRELYTLEVTDRTGTAHPARALSDGTLRFLALAVLELEPNAHGLLCLEEPENGIHPERIPAMLQLLQDIATDPNEAIGPDNPLRQVIINTHSPAVVALVPEDSLLVAENREMLRDNRRFRAVRFSPLPETWRQEHSDTHHAVAKGQLMAYLNPFNNSWQSYEQNQINSNRKSGRRVVDREDLQLMLPLSGEAM